MTVDGSPEFLFRKVLSQRSRAPFLRRVGFRRLCFLVDRAPTGTEEHELTLAVHDVVGEAVCVTSAAKNQVRGGRDAGVGVGRMSMPNVRVRSHGPKLIQHHPRRHAPVVWLPAKDRMTGCFGPWSTVKTRAMVSPPSDHMPDEARKMRGSEANVERGGNCDEA